MKVLLKARALERFVPAHGCHTQLQAYKGQNPFVLHLKPKPRKMTLRSHTRCHYSLSAKAPVSADLSFPLCSQEGGRSSN